MANIEDINQLLEDSIPSGVMGWVKKTTIKNAYSGFIEKVVEFVPDSETPIALAFDVFNVHADEKSFCALCTDINVYIDDPNYAEPEYEDALLYKIPLASIKEFSFNEGNVLTHDLKFVQDLNGLTVQWHWRYMVAGGALFNKFAYAMRRQLERVRASQ